MFVLFTTILSIIIMIAIHEFGHFIAGKMLKVPVYEFAIGMGPVIWSKQGKSETKYSLRAFPIGGFCSFDKGDANGIADMELNKYPAWKRIIIFAAGATLNIISALIVSISLCAFVGMPQNTTEINSIALEEADDFLQPGDIIKEVNGVYVENDYNLMTSTIRSDEDGVISLIVNRNGEDVKSDVKLIKNGDYYAFGVNVNVDYVKSEGFQPIIDGSKYAYLSGISILQSFGNLVTGKVKMSQMSGIIGVVSVVSDAAKDSLLNILSYFVLLSMNLGIFNLLPIPVLDGSKILFCIYEMIFKKRIPEKVEENLTVVFAVLIIGFIIVISVGDVVKIFAK